MKKRGEKLRVWYFIYQLATDRWERNGEKMMSSYVRQWDWVWESLSYLIGWRKCRDSRETYITSMYKNRNVLSDILSKSLQIDRFSLESETLLRRVTPWKWNCSARSIQDWPSTLRPAVYSIPPPASLLNNYTNYGTQCLHLTNEARDARCKLKESGEGPHEVNIATRFNVRELQLSSIQTWSSHFLNPSLAVISCRIGKVHPLK